MESNAVSELGIAAHQLFEMFISLVMVAALMVAIGTFMGFVQTRRRRRRDQDALRKHVRGIS